MNPSANDEPRAGRVELGAACNALMHLLTRAGITDLVVSPGSRSTPLIVAALQHKGLNLHSVIDERSAGFFALGLAKAQRRPVGMVCTSGSAAAHYLPAIIEAHYSEVPLVVLTADRPSKLQDCGAPQTIRQDRLYGDFTAGGTEHFEPQQTKESTCAALERLARALARSQGPCPGPVHVNVRLDKPLEPLSPSSEDERRLFGEYRDISKQAEMSFEQAPLDASFVEVVSAALSEAQRPLFTCGPLPTEDMAGVTRLAQQVQIPLLGEFLPEGGRGGLEFFAPFLEGQDAPDVIVHFGTPCVSGRWARYLDHFDGKYFVASGRQFKDPSRRAQRVLVCELAAAARALSERLESRDRPQWHASVSSAYRKIRKAVSQALNTAESLGQFGDPSAIEQILSALPASWNLLVGNSLPVRVASWVWTTQPQPSAPHTLRGANGIDGSIALATGLCQGGNSPTLALVGDVTALHDVGSLALAGRLEKRLVLAVLDNGGGRIFDHLPVRNAVHGPQFDYWTTPHSVDFGALAQAFNLNYLLVQSKEQMSAALLSAFEVPGATLLHVRTSPASALRFVEEVTETLQP